MNMNGFSTQPGKRAMDRAAGHAAREAIHLFGPVIPGPAAAAVRRGTDRG